MNNKELNKEICKELQKVAASFFNDVSDNLSSLGNSFTTYELCKLSRNKPALFGIDTKIVETDSIGIFGEILTEIHKQTITGKEETICIGDFKCTFDLASVFELLHKFEKLSGIKKMVFVIEEEKDTNAPCIVAPICKECNLSEQPDEQPGELVPAENIICIECEPEDIPDYWDFLDSAPDTYEATPAPVSIDAPTVQLPERLPTVLSGERLPTVYVPERLYRASVCHYLITCKGLYYLVA